MENGTDRHPDRPEPPPLPEWTSDATLDERIHAARHSIWALGVIVSAILEQHVDDIGEAVELVRDIAAGTTDSDRQALADDLDALTADALRIAEQLHNAVTGTH